MESAYKLATELSVVKDKKTSVWSTIDLSTLTTKQLFSQYRKIEVSVDDVFGKPKTLLLSIYENELRNREITIAEWLVETGNRTLVTLDGYPTLSFKQINYVPMAYRDVSIKLAKPNAHPDHDFPLEDQTDVVVAYDGVEPKRLHEYGLWSFNGFYLPTTYHAYGARLKGAGVLARNSGSLSAGFLNFEGVGKVRKVPITESMVFKVNDELTYFDSLIIKADEPLFNKSVGIVIGGYLHLLDGSYKVISEDAIMLSLRNLRYVDRVIDSKDILDLSFMDLDDLDHNAVVSNVRDDTNILKYLTCQYSFLVIIDNPEITRNTMSPEQHEVRSKYAIDKDAQMGALVDKLGRNLEYWPTYENGVWTLHTDRYEFDNHMFRTTDWFKMIRINDARVGSNITSKVKPTLVNFVARQK